MRKILAVIFACSLLLLSGCVRTTTNPVRIGLLKGPTALGSAYVMQNTKAFDVELLEDPEQLSDQWRDGTIDIAAVPIELATKLYNATNGDVVMLNACMLGIVYVMGDRASIQQMSDLANKTIYAYGTDPTQKGIFDYLIAQYGLTGQIQVKYVDQYNTLLDLISTGEAEIVLISEPYAAELECDASEFNVAIDLNKAWSESSGNDLVMGVFITSKEFYAEHPDRVNAFEKAYARSARKTNQATIRTLDLLNESDIFQGTDILYKAFLHTPVVSITGEEMKTAASAVLNVLYTANPASIGGKLPGDDLYAK